MRFSGRDAFRPIDGSERKTTSLQKAMVSADDLARRVDLERDQNEAAVALANKM